MHHLLNAALVFTCVAVWSVTLQKSASAHPHAAPSDLFAEPDAIDERIGLAGSAPDSRYVSQFGEDSKARAAVGGHRHPHHAGAEKVLKRTHTSWGWKPRGRRSVDALLSQLNE